MTVAIPVAEQQRKECLANLERWRQHMLAHDKGLTNCTLSREEITLALDKLLDELLELRGR